MSNSDAELVLPDPIDPVWNLPPAPAKGQPLSAPGFARLMAAAREGGWPAVWRTWAENEVTNEPLPNGLTRARPAKRRSLGSYLSDRRPDLKLLLDDAAQEKRDRLLNQLESEAEKIALGPGNVCRDFDKKTGAVTRERYETRDKLFAILQLLKATDRDRYGDHRRIEGSVTGSVTVDHRHSLGNGGSGLYIDPESVLLLPPADQQTFFSLLDRLAAAKAAQPKREMIDAPARVTLPDGANDND